MDRRRTRQPGDEGPALERIGVADAGGLSEFGRRPQPRDGRRPSRRLVAGRAGGHSAGFFVPQLALAGLGRRLAAAAIGFLRFLCKLPLFMAGLQVFKYLLQHPQTPPEPDKLTAMLFPAYAQTLPLLGLLAVVQITLLCLRSQSIGKLLLRLRIVGVQDELPGGPVRAFLLRAFLPTLIEFIPLLGLMFWLVDTCFIFREDHRCIHDLIAGTKVVKL